MLRKAGHDANHGSFLPLPAKRKLLIQAPARVQARPIPASNAPSQRQRGLASHRNMPTTNTIQRRPAGGRPGARIAMQIPARKQMATAFPAKATGA